jgi:hypothetical protein
MAQIRKVRCKIQPLSNWKVLVVDNGPTAPYTVESYVRESVVGNFGIGTKLVWRIIYKETATIYHEALIAAGKYLAATAQAEYEKVR